MGRWIARQVWGLVAILLLAGLGLAQEIVATPQKAGGVYEVGEKIQWRVEVTGNVTPPVTEAQFVLKKGGLTVMREGTIDLTSGSGELQTTLDAPGTVLAEIKVKLPNKELKRLVGAAVEPQKIQPSAPRPADFDAFWTAKIEELQAVPANPTLEPADSGNAAVDYCKVQLDNIRGTHIYGQLAKPKREGKFPAMLIVPWAGVYPLPKANVVYRAQAGWLALNIMSHDLPFDQPQEFYNKASSTTLKDYTSIGNDDRETSYFLRMYLGCYRAADYLAGRPDWDGRTLVVTGTSQGGLQSFVTAAIYPKITALIADVPAGCDTTGMWAERAPGWPYAAHYLKDARGQKIMETSRYFDVVNFASRIKCPAMVALGLIDVTCPPAGVFAACNQLQGPKEVLVMVDSGHQSLNGSQKLYDARSAIWAAELLKGNPVPPK